MNHQKHIINKQILEIQLPITANVFEEQQKLSLLYREQWIPIIDKILSRTYGDAHQKSVQIDTLTIDLGVLEMKDLTTVFEEKFQQVFEEVEASQTITEVILEKKIEAQQTPLRVMSYFLKTGLLPWWVSATSKTFLQEQVNILIQTQEPTFIKILSQLRFNSLYLERFLYNCTSNQILECLQLLSNITIQNLVKLKNEGLKEVKQKLEENKIKWNDITVETNFGKAIFQQITEVKNHEILQKVSVTQTLLTLGIYATKDNTANQNKKRNQIQLLITKQQKQYRKDTAWQSFFKQLDVFIQSPSFLQVSSDLLKNFEKVLKRLDVEKNKKNSIIDTKVLLKPIAEHVQRIQKTIQKAQPYTKPMAIDQLQSTFEDTDFITVQNAGLVLLWPFLQRFFENVELLNHKEFKDDTAKAKAACLLHYIVDDNEASLFEGTLPLNKVLCGIPLSETVALEPLKKEEKVIIDGLLQAVMQRGPHWKNLSIAGFRTSYLQREGLLRSRDGHWLLQVKKETYDITLEKIPWGFGTVKLPWMNQIIVVEWM
ncbi:contractile injection system tape measure protein [Flavobacterium sp. J27]|uniref:contractile injection system tape measure protein n=1 Tax=Flavobacterium sp. J27 TaxID=2060419 RepID=UPI001030E72F|nr:contractile injection system tape measure protein [Flavobacterium sp. J27]